MSSLSFTKDSAKSVATPFELNNQTLKDLGLQDTDVEEIHSVAESINPDNPLTVSQFGRDAADHTSEYVDELLEQVRNTDLKVAGQKLTEVVSVAQELNLGSLEKSSVPILGPVIDMVKRKSAKSNFAAKFESTREQVERLVEEVSITQQTVGERNHGLQHMHEAVQGEHRLLGVHIAAGQLKLATLRENADDLRNTVGNGPRDLQRLADLDAMASNLDKRIGDLRALQHSALQSLPTIRMIQSNNLMLIDKFHTIREITVPAWKRQFMLAVSLDEQQDAVQLAEKIDDTTNAMLRSNADLLYSNSVSTAKANQRLVIDVETLKQVQDTLIKTVNEVSEIQKKGEVERGKAEKQIAGMRSDLHRRLKSVKSTESGAAVHQTSGTVIDSTATETVTAAGE